MSITEFLLARIAEDEEQAHRSVGPTSEDWRIVREWREGVAARVLAECQAKRAIVGMLAVGWPQADDRYTLGWQDAVTITLRKLAATYSDHPDYRQEWKP